MGKSLNKTMLIGNVGSIETRYTGEGKPVVNLTLATDQSYRDSTTGQVVPQTEWHRVVIFGKLAEVASQYVQAGSKLYLEGRNQTRKYPGKDGQDRFVTEVVVDGRNGDMTMLSAKQANTGAGAAATPSQQAPQRYSASAAGADTNQAVDQYGYAEGEIPGFD